MHKNGPNLDYLLNYQRFTAIAFYFMLCCAVVKPKVDLSLFTYIVQSVGKM